MRTRFVSMVVIFPFGIGLVCWPGAGWGFPGWPLALLVFVMSLQMVREYLDACEASGRSLQRSTAFAGVLCFCLDALPLSLDPRLRLSVLLPVLFLASLIGETLLPRRAPAQNLAPTWLGILYVGGLFSCLIRLRCGTEQVTSQLDWHAAQPWMRFIGEGACVLLFLILVMTATDTGALLVGRRWGRRKLAPAVSPGKTWEGAVGGMVLGVMVGLAGGIWFGMPLGFATAAAVLASLFGQLGDLCESALKRELGVKDFGSLLPGHGGLLDRFDNLLFTGAVTYVLVLLWR